MYEHKRIMFMAGELSGDMHGAYLAREVRSLCPTCTLFGIGGKAMKQEGVDIIGDITRKHTMGFLSNITLLFFNLPLLISLVSKVRRIFKFYRPDVLVLIDNQGLNMFFAAMAKKYGIRTVYYIAPQEWLWGTTKGMKKVISTIDVIIAIFSKEYDAYRQYGDNVIFSGHPLVDIVPQSLHSKTEAAKRSNIVGLFPGSRSIEIRSLTGALCELAGKLYEKDSSLSFKVAVSDNRDMAYIKKVFSKAAFPVDLVEQNSHELIAESALVIGASGTLTLECAILETPMIVLYKLKDLDYFVAKNILKIKVDFISLPNIIAQSMIFPEFIQDDIDTEKIAEIAVTILRDEKVYNDTVENLREVKKDLGPSGAIRQAAKTVLQQAALS